MRNRSSQLVARSSKIENLSSQLSGGEILSGHLVPPSGPSSGLVDRSSQPEKRSSQLVARSSQKIWNWTLICICILALTPVLSANDDGEILDASIVLTVSPDFKVKEEVTITKRLDSYQALDTDGDPRTPYCDALQTLTITKARVTTPGGKVVDCTPNALNLSTPDALVAHPELSSWQEMVVTFLGLEPGAQTELSYIREDKAAFRTTFEKKQVLAWHFPIRKGTVTVRLPKNMPLTYQIMNFKGEASANAVADLMEYTFTFKDIPAFSDRDMHSGAAFLPTLYLTTTPSWESAWKTLTVLAEKNGSPDEAIKKKAIELTKDALTVFDKAIAIHKFIKERFREVEWPLQDSLLLFNSADKTLTAGQGTNLELALLLKAMFEAVDLEARLMLSGPLPIAEKAFGIVGFDRATILSKAMYWDPSKPPSSSAELEGRATLLWEGGLKTASIGRGVVLVGSLESCNGGDLNGTASLTFTGELNPYWNNLEEKDVLESAAKAFLPFPGLKLVETQVKALGWDETRMEVKFTAKPMEGDHVLRLLPETKTFLHEIDPRIVSTALPIRLPDAQVSVKWTIKGMGKGEPMEFKPVQRAGEISIVRKLADDGFILEANLDLGLETLPPADYTGLQAALAAWQNPVVAGLLLP